MATSLAQLAELIAGRLIGDGTLSIVRAATLDEARSGDLAFLDSASKAPLLQKCQASAVLVPNDFLPTGFNAIQVADVHRAFAAVVCHFRPQRATGRCGVSPQASVHPTAKIGADVDIHPFATIGEDVQIGDRATIHSGVHIMDGCRIDEDVTIYPGAILYENTTVGARSVVHARAVLGAHGFGYKYVDGRHILSAQLGYVEIGADVEIGAGTTIDRGTYSATVIGEGTKVDNQVMIAHNCRIGRHNMICSQVGIAGSTTTGDYVVMAGQVGVRDHVHIGTGAVIGAQAGVANDVPAGAHMLGSPATLERDQKLIFAAISKLPELRREFKQVRRKVDTLLADDGPSGVRDQAA